VGAGCGVHRVAWHRAVPVLWCETRCGERAGGARPKPPECRPQGGPPSAAASLFRQIVSCPKRLSVLVDAIASLTPDGVFDTPRGAQTLSPPFRPRLASHLLAVFPGKGHGPLGCPSPRDTVCHLQRAPPPGRREAARRRPGRRRRPQAQGERGTGQHRGEADYDDRDCASHTLLPCAELFEFRRRVIAPYSSLPFAGELGAAALTTCRGMLRNFARPSLSTRVATQTTTSSYGPKASRRLAMRS